MHLLLLVSNRMYCTIVWIDNTDRYNSDKILYIDLTLITQDITLRMNNRISPPSVPLAVCFSMMMVGWCSYATFQLKVGSRKLKVTKGRLQLSHHFFSFFWVTTFPSGATLFRQYCIYVHTEGSIRTKIADYFINRRMDDFISVLHTYVHTVIFFHGSLSSIHYLFVFGAQFLSSKETKI